MRSAEPLEHYGGELFLWKIAKGTTNKRYGKVHAN